MSITANIQEVVAGLPPGVRLVAISKYQPAEAVREAYDAGQRVFGESRAQELKDKQPQLPPDIEWHFVGTLQKNKIKYIIPFVTLIHSIDSFSLLAEVDKYARKEGRTVDCLLQIHIAREETKFGFAFGECREMLEEGTWKSLANIRIRGLMGMATFTDSQEQVADEFRSLKGFFEEIKKEYFPDETGFSELSMGMSDDYRLAVGEGSTLVRVGSRIFGERRY